MFNIGAGEMILIALVLLIAVGPEQLPSVIRRTGRMVGELKTMSDNLRRDFSASLDEIERAADVKSWAGAELESTVEMVKEAAEPFKADFDSVDETTKVKDIWSNPPRQPESVASEADELPAVVDDVDPAEDQADDAGGVPPVDASDEVA